MRQILNSQQEIQPHVREFFLDGVLPQPGGKVLKIYPIHRLHTTVMTSGRFRTAGREHAWAQTTRIWFRTVLALHTVGAHDGLTVIGALWLPSRRTASYSREVPRNIARQFAGRRTVSRPC